MYVSINKVIRAALGMLNWRVPMTLIVFVIVSFVFLPLFPIKLTCCCASSCSETVVRVEKILICWKEKLNNLYMSENHATTKIEMHFVLWNNSTLIRGQLKKIELFTRLESKALRQLCDFQRTFTDMNSLLTFLYLNDTKNHDCCYLIIFYAYVMSTHFWCL